nr:splicing factor [Tanacetum cinerariifolium]
MAGKLWVVQEVEEVEQEEEEVVAEEEEDVLIDGDNIKKSIEHEHMQGLLVEQEDLRQKQEKEHQDKLDEEALQQAIEEDLMFKRMDLEREREEQQWEAMMDPLNDYRFPDEEESMVVEIYNITKASKKHHGEHS